jgi:hypothetical protein
MHGEERKDSLIISARVFARYRVRTLRDNNPLAVRPASYQLISDPEKEPLTSLAIRQQSRNSDGFRHIAAQPAVVSSRRRRARLVLCTACCIAVLLLLL